MTAAPPRYTEERPAGYIYGTGGEPAGRRSPACGAGVLLVKASRHGPFVGCGARPACGDRRALASGSDAAARAGPKRLGTDPASGLAVSLRRGPHGHCIELAGAGEAKPRSMSVSGGMDAGRDRARGRAEAARAAARSGRSPCKRAVDPGRHRPLRSLGAARRDLRGDTRGRGRADGPSSWPAPGRRSAGACRCRAAWIGTGSGSRPR